MIPCNHCRQGEPFTEREYDPKTMCRFCWLYDNSKSYRSFWGGNPEDLNHLFVKTVQSFQPTASHGFT